MAVAGPYSDAGRIRPRNSAMRSYRPARKAQDKPLELLKLLICCQAMRRDSADKQWLAQRLWPDADDANARKSLDMTLSRLRRLLRDDDAIVASESRLAFSPNSRLDGHRTAARCAFPREPTSGPASAGGRVLHRAAASAEVAAVLEHFKGPFLPEDEGPSWLLAGREADRRCGALDASDRRVSVRRRQGLQVRRRARARIQRGSDLGRPGACVDALVDPFGPARGGSCASIAGCARCFPSCSA